MKNLFIILFSCLIICLFAGISIHFILDSDEETGNVKHSYEYYYNDDIPTGGDNLKTTTVTNLSETAKIHANILNPQRLPETNPQSIAILINRDYSLPTDYIPSDLIVPDISFNISYYNEKKLMRKEAAKALEKLFQTAEKSDIKLNAVSGYRSYARQEEIYNENLKTKGDAHTNQYSAKPGFSEHQSGLSMDVSAPSMGNQLVESLIDTSEGKWLADNCHLFGFTIRYPKDKEAITFYSYEPWHLRYVGIELAGYLFENRLTMEEFYNYVPSEEVKNSLFSDSMVDIDPLAEQAADPTQAPAVEHNSSDSETENTEDEDVPRPKATSQKKTETSESSTPPEKTPAAAPIESTIPTEAEPPVESTEPTEAEPPVESTEPTEAEPPVESTEPPAPVEPTVPIEPTIPASKDTPSEEEDPKSKPPTQKPPSVQKDPVSPDDTEDTLEAESAPETTQSAAPTPNEDPQ